MRTVQQDRNTVAMIREGTANPGPLLLALLTIAEEGLDAREAVERVEHACATEGEVLFGGGFEWVTTELVLTHLRGEQ